MTREGDQDVEGSLVVGALGSPARLSLRSCAYEGNGNGVQLASSWIGCRVKAPRVCSIVVATVYCVIEITSVIDIKSTVLSPLRFALSLCDLLSALARTRLRSIHSTEHYTQC